MELTDLCVGPLDPILEPARRRITPVVTPRGEERGEAEVARLLAIYLRERWGRKKLRFTQAPRSIADGWETYTYRFQLDGEDAPEGWDRPLILRVHVGAHGVPRVQHEVAVHRFLVESGYPVPRVLLHEARHQLFGGPFQVMHEIPGCMLLQTLFWAPWRILTAPALMAELHARLHRLPSMGFPKPAEQFLNLPFKGIATLIDQHELDGLRAGLAWLQANHPARPREPSVLHLDYHPLNLLGDGNGSFAVIDWTYAEVGDPHADVGTTLMLMECVPVRGQSWLKRSATALGRPHLCRAYLQEYQKHRPLDPERLAFYRAWAALRRLAIYGRWLRAGPASAGCKAGVAARLDATHLGTLERYFQTWSGVPARLGGTV